MGEKTVCAALVARQAGVKGTPWDTESNARSAKRLEGKPFVKVNLAEMHQANLRNEDDESPLWKHCSLEHNGDKVEFSRKALRGFTSCLERQVNNAVRVTSSQADVISNSNN